MTDAAAGDEEAERTWCLAEVDIFCDLSEQEMEAIAQAAPMKTYHAGEILYSPTQPSEVLFILKRGRVRVFRVSADGRASPPRSSPRAPSSAKWSCSDSTCTTTTPKPSTTPSCV
ncbi:cyclic nucleotide-binding domain-containing protein [Streptomyces vastus]